MINKARDLAKLWHSGQMYGSQPYYKHLSHVEAKVVELYRDDNELSLLRMTAVLHDLFEDTKCSEMDLKVRIGNYRKIDTLIEALHAITKRDNESREDYLVRCVENPIALKVKIADTLCNLECSIQSGEERRIKKYSKQIDRLLEFVWQGVRIKVT